MSNTAYTKLIQYGDEAYLYKPLEGIINSVYLGANERKICENEQNLLPGKYEEELILDRFCDKILNDRLELTIMPTEQCNFRCTYCYEEYKKGTISVEGKNALVKAIQSLLHEHTSLHIAWFGGEPLLAYEEILDLSKKIIMVCEAQKKKYTASMTTNGYYLTRERFVMLQKMHVYYYQVTIDGLKEQHDRQRTLVNGTGTFDIVMANLQSLKDIRFRNHITPQIMIRMNFTKSMMNNVEEILSYFGSKFSDSSRFSFLFRTVGDYGGDKVRKIQAEILSYEALAKIYKAVYESEYCFNIETQISMTDNGYCYAAKKNSFVIGSDLKIYKCTVHFQESLIGEITDAGKFIYDKKLNAQWYTMPLKNILGTCKNCEQLPRCLSCTCPYKVLTTNKTKSDNCTVGYDEELIFWTLQCLRKMGYLKEAE